MRLIGINGFKTSGKDTTYGLLKRMQPDKDVQRAAFADKLKHIGALALGFEGYDDEELVMHMDDLKETGKIAVEWEFEAVGLINGTERAVKSITGRQYLQYLGAHARTVFGDTFWIDQILPQPRYNFDSLDRETFPDRRENERALARRYPGADILCVTDVRYANEAERILELDGEIWEVVRPGLDSDGHSSEIPLPDNLVTHTIINDSDLDALAEKVGDLL